MKDKKIQKYKLYVKLNKKENKLVFINDVEIIAQIKEKPIDNKANIKLIELLSLHFNINRNNINIKGLRSKIKYITIKHE